MALYFSISIFPAVFLCVQGKLYWRVKRGQTNKGYVVQNLFAPIVVLYSLDQTTNLIISPALRAAPCATCNTSLKSLVANNVLLTDDDDDEDDDENDLLRIEFEPTNWRFCTTGNEFILRA